MGDRHDDERGEARGVSGAMRIGWAAYGSLDQPTGGYVYDRLVVRGLRDRGDVVELADLLGRPPLPVTGEDGRPLDAIVGDALCVRELGPGFERVPRGTARVLLVHHLTSWEMEPGAGGALRAAAARALAAAGRIVVTGEATGARLSREYAGVRADVILPGADRLARAARPEREGAGLAVLFGGSLLARKRVLLLLDAVEQAGADGVTVTLVGDGGREPAYARAIAERIAASPTLRAVVRVVGVQAEDDLVRTMARSDVLVLPSSLEGYGMVLTEALHAGLPVLVSRATGLAAGLDTSPAAMVFDDAAGLAAALRALAFDPDRRGRLERAALAVDLPRWVDAVPAFRASITRAVATARASDRAPAPR